MGDEFEKYHSFLQENDPIIVAILKGHLALEAILSDILASLTDRGELIAEAANSFHRKRLIAQAHSGSQSNDAAWELLAKINSVRNRTAHNLDSDDVRPLIAEIGNILRARDAVAFDLIPDKSDDYQLITHTVSFLVGFLEAYRRETAA